MTKPQYLITLWQNASDSEDVRYCYSSIHPDAKGEKFVDAVKCFFELHVNHWPTSMSKKRVAQIVDELLDNGVVCVLKGKIMRDYRRCEEPGYYVLRLVKQVKYKRRRL